jgi:hypothetical protein
MKVLVAVDDSDGSRHALAWVLDHLFPAAEQQHEEEPQPPPVLVLVHAQEPLRHVMMYPVGPGDSTSPQAAVPQHDHGHRLMFLVCFGSASGHTRLTS